MVERCDMRGPLSFQSIVQLQFFGCFLRWFLSRYPQVDQGALRGLYNVQERVEREREGGIYTASQGPRGGAWFGENVNVTLVLNGI